MTAPCSLFLPCPRGLEETLQTEIGEIATLTGSSTLHATGRAGGGVMAAGNIQDVMRLNLWSRIASRVLIHLHSCKYQSESDIYQPVMALHWHEYMDSQQTLRIDLTAHQSPLKSLNFATLKIKDAICDAMRAHTGARPSINTSTPDVRVYAHLTRDEMSIYLDTSGEPLFKRGWRRHKGEAPLKENLAAGMVQLMVQFGGWTAERPLLDAFCGSGTVMIEAAQWALKRAPGAQRPFGFEQLKGMDQAAWRRIKAQAQEVSASARAVQLCIEGSDRDERVISIARANAQIAGVPQLKFDVKDARALRPTHPQGWILSNPPYGERLEADAKLFAAFSQTLKHHFNGWQCWLISADLSLPKHLGLKPMRKVPLFNGPLDTRLFGFEIVGGQYRNRTAASAAGMAASNPAA
jgi:putative N6-adenine-specific DNA methylase